MVAETTTATAPNATAVSRQADRFPPYARLEMPTPTPMIQPRRRGYYGARTDERAKGRMADLTVPARHQLWLMRRGKGTHMLAYPAGEGIDIRELANCVRVLLFRV